MLFKVFFVISDVYAVRYHRLFIPTTHVSLLPGVMFCMHDTKKYRHWYKKKT